MIFPLKFDYITCPYKEYQINKNKILSDLAKLKSSYLIFEDNYLNYETIIIVGQDEHACAAKVWSMIPYSWVNMYEQHIKVVYLDHFSPDSLWEIIANCNLQNTFVIFISYETYNSATILTLMRFVESISRFVGTNIHHHIAIATNIDEKNELLNFAEIFSIKVLPLSNCIFRSIYPGVVFPSVLWGLNYKKILYSAIENIEYMLRNDELLKYIFQVCSFFYLKQNYVKIISPSSDKLRPLTLWWKETMENNINIKYIQSIDTRKTAYYLDHFLNKSYTTLLIDQSLTRDSLDFNMWQWKLDERHRNFASTTLKQWIETSSYTLLDWIKSNNGLGRIIHIQSMTQEIDICAIMLFISLEIEVLSMNIRKSRLEYELDKISYDKIKK